MRKLLKKYRLAAGFESMTQAAEAAGMTRQAWANLEKTNADGTIRNWRLIQKALGLTGEEVWSVITEEEEEE